MLPSILLMLFTLSIDVYVLTVINKANTAIQKLTVDMVKLSKSLPSFKSYTHTARKAESRTSNNIVKYNIFDVRICLPDLGRANNLILLIYNTKNADFTRKLRAI